VPNPSAPSLTIFDEDFDEVAAVFKDLTETGTYAALPGGVRDTYVPQAERYPLLSLEPNEFRGYRMDTGTYLGEAKRTLAQAIIAVEGISNLTPDNLTICPAVSFGLLACTLAMKEIGITTVLLEAPCYYASVEQSLALGLDVHLLPTRATDGYRLSPEHLAAARQSVDGRCVLIVTQPRYGTGANRDASEIAHLRSLLSAGDILLIDEAADQTVPAPMACLPLEGDVQLWRVRGLTKGLGLNSARMATIIHPLKLRNLFGDVVDYAGGNLDSASLKLMVGLASDPQFYIAQLRAAQEFVSNQWNMFGRDLMGLPVCLSPIESGYFATLRIDTGTEPENFLLWRQRFLKACYDNRMPVVLGSSMYFPYDRTAEIVRINYFTPPEVSAQPGARTDCPRRVLRIAA
jgi:hypothetical protein